jgi:hypothetical protein
MALNPTFRKSFGSYSNIEDSSLIKRQQNNIIYFNLNLKNTQHQINGVDLTLKV